MHKLSCSSLNSSSSHGTYISSGVWCTFYKWICTTHLPDISLSPFRCRLCWAQIHTQPFKIIFKTYQTSTLLLKLCLVLSCTWNISKTTIRTLGFTVMTVRISYRIVTPIPVFLSTISNRYLVLRFRFSSFSFHSLSLEVASSYNFHIVNSLFLSYEFRSPPYESATGSHRWWIHNWLGEIWRSVFTNLIFTWRPGSSFLHQSSLSRQ